MDKRVSKHSIQTKILLLLLVFFLSLSGFCQNQRHFRGLDEYFRASTMDKEEEIWEKSLQFSLQVLVQSIAYAPPVYWYGRSLSKQRFGAKAVFALVSSCFSPLLSLISQFYFTLTSKTKPRKPPLLWLDLRKYCSWFYRRRPSTKASCGNEKRLRDWSTTESDESGTFWMLWWRFLAFFYVD